MQVGTDKSPVPVTSATYVTDKQTETLSQSFKLRPATHTHNRFTALLEYVWDHPGEQVPER